MEENGFPVAPAILGMVLGAMLEEHFIRAMIRADGEFVGFVQRPIAAGLAVAVFLVLAWPIAAWLLRRKA
jgi:TctA family transporter